jgi:hypothetical protein
MDMLRLKMAVTVSLLMFCPALALHAQQAAMATESSIVPPLMKYSGALVDAQNKPLTGTVGITFSLYKQQEGGAALWIETQNVALDKNGRYSVLLGTATSQGLPADVFASGDARWLGVHAQGASDPARTLLMSVPYALKAADAETIGGLPASAFMKAPASASANANATNQLNPAITGTGVANHLAKWTGTSALASSNIFDSTGKVGIATTAPTAELDVNGTTRLRGNTTVNGNISATDISATAITTQTLAASTTGTAITGTMSAANNNAAAITGNATATGDSGFTFGVWGLSSSNQGRGVVGQASGNSVAGVIGEVTSGGNGSGVVGKALPGSTGFGVYGNTILASATGSQGYMAGVWGDTGLSGSTNIVTSVLGTADNAVAGTFLNNTGSYFTLFADALSTSGFPFHAFNSANGTGCYVDPGGSINCTGSKNAVVPLDGGKRKVALSAIESPANWFEDFGSARLVNGVAVIKLDPDFMQTVNTGKAYRVFPVPNGDCKGLYVTNKTANSFEVRELGGGTSNVSFDYRITAIRRNYEAVRFADHTTDPDPRKMLESMGKHKTLLAPASVAAAPALPAAKAHN